MSRTVILARAAGCAAALAAVVLAAGCAAVNPAPAVDGLPVAPAPRPSAAPAPAPPANGSIYQAGGYRPMFESHRARRVGDTLTVQIVERASASQKSNSAVDKSGKVDGSISALPFLAPNSFARASVGGANSNGFSGKGSTESSNDFSGTITTTVIDVLANGHLVVAGEKQIGVNHNVEVLRFSGQVDPVAIQPGNTVVSAQIANVRLEHRGRGAQAEAQGIGWLSRAFLNVLPF